MAPRNSEMVPKNLEIMTRVPRTIATGGNSSYVAVSYRVLLVGRRPNGLGLRRWHDCDRPLNVRRRVTASKVKYCLPTPQRVVMETDPGGKDWLVKIADTSQANPRGKSQSR